MLSPSLRRLPRRAVSALSLPVLCFYLFSASYPLQAQPPALPPGVTQVTGPNGQPAYVVNGMEVSDLSTSAVEAFLGAHDGSPVLSELMARGIPPDAVHWAQIAGVSPGDDFAKVAQGLSAQSLAAGGQPVTAYAVWSGGFQQSDPMPGKNAVAVTLYVATLADQSQQLIAATITDQADANANLPATVFEGDFLSGGVPPPPPPKVPSTPPATPPAPPSGTPMTIHPTSPAPPANPMMTSPSAAAAAPARPLQKRAPVLRAQVAAAGGGFRDCFTRALSDAGIAIGAVALTCAIGAAIACVGATLGYAACLAIGLAACGLTSVAGVIIGCALGCLIFA